MNVGGGNGGDDGMVLVVEGKRKENVIFPASPLYWHSLKGEAP